MVREQTLTTIDSDVKRQAKERGLNFSQILEEALKKKLDPDNIIENLEREKLECLERVDEINREIDKLKDAVIEVENQKDEEEERLQMALDYCLQSHQRLGYVRRNVLDFQAEKYRVSKSALESALIKKVGEVANDGEASIRSG